MKKRESPLRAVEVTNRQQDVKINDALIRDVAQFTLESEGVARAEISIVFVDNAQIHTLNRKYLDHDEPTDVLSFLLDSCPVTDADDQKTNGRRIDGEVIVSAEMAGARAGEYCWTPENELLLYVVHGLLHLCGYDDHSETDRETMRSREREILSQWNLSPQYDPP